MVQRVILAVLMAVAWMAITARLSVDAFAVGLLLGIAILTLTQARTQTARPMRVASLPAQALAIVVYFVTLCRDIWLSAVDVAEKSIQPVITLNSGIIAVPTQDPTHNASIAALSAHAITITPGELVVEFDGSEVMYVHCLDAESSAQTLKPAQAKRLSLIRRMLGHE